MDEDLKISIFLPTLNRADNIKDTLDSIAHQSYKNYELVVVDGGSTDNTLEIVETYSAKFPIKFVKQKRIGLVGATNDGLENSSGEIFIRTDDDATYDVNWLKEIVNAFKINENIGGVTGPTIVPEEYMENRDLLTINKKIIESKSNIWKLFSKIYHGYFMEGKPFAVGKFFRSGAFSIGADFKECLETKEIFEVDFLEACNASIKRKLIEEVGGIDNNYVGLGEYNEPDLAFRVKKLGYKLVFNPKAISYHCPSVSGVFEARSNAYTRSQNFILFYFRHIKPNTIDKFIRFFSYLTFINIYWLFKYLVSRKMNVLMGIPGTLVGLIKYLPELKNRT